MDALPILAATEAVPSVPAADFQVAKDFALAISKSGDPNLMIW
jgi:hypothetical protein